MPIPLHYTVKITPLGDVAPGAAMECEFTIPRSAFHDGTFLAFLHAVTTAMENTTTDAATTAGMLGKLFATYAERWTVDDAKRETVN